MLTVYVIDGVVKQQTRIQITLRVANETYCHKGNETNVQYLIMNVCGKLFAVRDELKDEGTVIQVHRVLKVIRVLILRTKLFQPCKYIKHCIFLKICMSNYIW